ncbi:hypothetical protein NN561_000530 [Cricetulus griseus]
MRGGRYHPRPHRSHHPAVTQFPTQKAAAGSVGPQRRERSQCCSLSHLLLVSRPSSPSLGDRVSRHLGPAASSWGEDARPRWSPVPVLEVRGTRAGLAVGFGETEASQTWAEPGQWGAGAAGDREGQLRSGSRSVPRALPVPEWPQAGQGDVLEPQQLG